MSSLKPSIFTCKDDLSAALDVGGKASALARLAPLSLSIPEWFVITSRALSDNSGSHFQTDSALEAEIMENTRTLMPDARSFAVRSSAMDEDGIHQSFAGLYESFLFVRSGQLLEAIEAVWRSGTSDRVLAYRRTRGIANAPRMPAVLVQRMIDSDVAGVAFSADPISCREDCTLVSAVFGIGSALVSGEVNSDDFTVDQNGVIVSRRIAIKDVAHRGNGSRQGVRAVPIPIPQRTQPALSDSEAIEVAKLARLSANHFCRPQDIEWASHNRKIWLLQSRPITTPNLETNSQRRS